MDPNRRKGNQLEWYVMRCRRSADIAPDIDAYMANKGVAAANRIEGVFIPAVVLQRMAVTKHSPDDDVSEAAMTNAEAARTANGIRSALRSFVFLLVRPSGLAALENLTWNRGRYRLFHYRDYSGQKVTARQDMMDRFVDACNDYGNKLEISTVNQQIRKGITVVVREGAFAGMEAEVVDLQYKADGVRFTIAVKLFAKGNYAYVHDRKVEDVMVKEKDAYVFNSDFIQRMEDSLLTIVKKRIKGKVTTSEMADSDKQLRQYYRLRHASISDEVLSVRFLSLMSICAAVLNNSTAKSRYIHLLKERIKDIRQQPLTSGHRHRSLAYLLSALYFCTKDAVYRTELKDIVRDHTPPSDVLRHHVAILRNM